MGRGMGWHQSHDAVTVDWITPPHVLAALGAPDRFDLDPCASRTQPFPTARRSYTEGENGLLKPWVGKVWLNPPYANRVIDRWLGRMGEHANGIALIFARTDTEAFHRSVFEKCKALLFLEGRLFFFTPEGKEAPHNGGAPSVLCAYSDDDAGILERCGLPGAIR